VKLQKEPKYELIKPETPQGVMVEQDNIDAVRSLRCADHDLKDVNKFPELDLDKYISIRLTSDSQEIIVKPREWVTAMENIGILNLFYIPHFGKSAKINMCVKLLLSCVHIGFIWLDRLISIDIELITWIIGL
jgi:hypothetical protein